MTNTRGNGHGIGFPSVYRPGTGQWTARRHVHPGARPVRQLLHRELVALAGRAYPPSRRARGPPRRRPMSAGPVRGHRRWDDVFIYPSAQPDDEGSEQRSGRREGDAIAATGRASCLRPRPTAGSQCSMLTDALYDTAGGPLHQVAVRAAGRPGSSASRSLRRAWTLGQGWPSGSSSHAADVAFRTPTSDGASRSRRSRRSRRSSPRR